MGSKNAEDCDTNPVPGPWKPLGQPGIYDQDGLRSMHNHEFMGNPDFLDSYIRGARAAGEDYHWHWRVHIGLWAAETASKLQGDFVECGVNRGFMASAIMHYLDWNSQNRVFYLLDTFRGLDDRYVSGDELESGYLDRSREQIISGRYVTGAETVRRNFSEWRNVKIIEGAVPDTLDQIDAEQVAFAHMDMNCSPPEVAAMEFMWDRFVPGALILFDDYAYTGYHSLKRGMDAFSRRKDVSIVSLPTGQGLMVRPPVG